ncbi:MAG: hypothetical protein ACREVE_07385 [Gammaproteobacteria bacterium]
MTGISFNSFREPAAVSEGLNIKEAAIVQAQVKQSACVVSAVRMFSCLAIFFMSPADLMAQAWVVQPGVSLEGIYDDNFRLSSVDAQEVTTARVAGSLKLARVTDTSDITGLVRVDGNAYFGDDEGLDDQSNQLLDFSYFTKGELSRWGGTISFRRDTLLRSIRAIEGTDDPTLEPDPDVDEGLTRTNVERQRLSLGPSWSRFLTERTEVGLSYLFTDSSYHDVPVTPAGDDDIVDFQNHLVGGELLTRVTERDRLALIFEGRRYEADDDAKFNNYDLQTGVVHDFSETFQGRFTIGARYTEFDVPAEFDVDPVTGVPTLVRAAQEGDDTGFVATIGGVKRTGLTTFAGTLERTASPSASGEIVQNDQLALNVSRQLSERTEIIIRSTIYETESLRDIRSNANRRFIAVEPRLRYELSPSWALEAAYEYRRIKEFDEPESADSNAVMLSLNYELPVVVEPEAPLDAFGID